MLVKQDSAMNNMPDSVSMFYNAAAATITTDVTAKFRRQSRRPAPARVGTQSKYAIERALVARFGS